MPPSLTRLPEILVKKSMWGRGFDKTGFVWEISNACTLNTLGMKGVDARVRQGRNANY